jgi:hypothetical protein
MGRRLGGGEEIRGGLRQAASRLGKNGEREEESKAITPAIKTFHNTTKSLFFFICAVLSSFGLLCSLVFLCVLYVLCFAFYIMFFLSFAVFYSSAIQVASRVASRVGQKVAELKRHDTGCVLLPLHRGF